MRDEKQRPEEDEEVGLGALAPDDLGETRDKEDLPPAEETKTPYDEA